MPRTINHPPERKTKKSYTISFESVAFLESVRKKRRSPSVSAILEEILQQVRREEERAALDRAVTDYYSSISDAERSEQAQWGEFAEREFPSREGN